MKRLEVWSYMVERNGRENLFSVEKVNSPSTRWTTEVTGTTFEINGSI